MAMMTFLPILAHDLGYPLKKIQKINNAILKILPHFAISNFGTPFRG
jgi:hypothetical protein